MLHKESNKSKNVKKVKIKKKKLIIDNSQEINVKVSKRNIYELGIETSKILNNKQYELQNITWTNGESNLDTEYSELACTCCEEAWDVIKKRYPIYHNVCIICEKPDINITFKYSDGRISKDKIELKSSKSKRLPGSTIKKLDINKTLIYCLRPSDKTKLYKIRCSQYYNAMGQSNIETFQDRTPRPFINFDKMNDIDYTLPFNIREKNDWIEHYANCALKRIEGNTHCQKSWQDDMIKILKKKIIEDYVRNTTEQEFKIYKSSL